MFEGLASDTRRNFHVVHNMTEALDLVGVSRPSFKPMGQNVLSFMDRAS
jgi:hypothetical protein